MKKPITDTQRLDWLERNLQHIAHDRGTCSTSMDGCPVRGQLLNEAKGQNAGPGSLYLKAANIRELVDRAMAWKGGA